MKQHNTMLTDWERRLISEIADIYAEKKAMGGPHQLENLRAEARWTLLYVHTEVQPLDLKRLVRVENERHMANDVAVAIARTSGGVYFADCWPSLRLASDDAATRRFKTHRAMRQDGRARLLVKVQPKDGCVEVLSENRLVSFVAVVKQSEHCTSARFVASDGLVWAGRWATKTACRRMLVNFRRTTLTEKECSLGLYSSGRAREAYNKMFTEGVA